ncbi:FAD binding domain-containing protein [Polyplosphaeria fusca]|uniref:FAD binding domain-containing protein n=1 Tax=Polyplosphaeria fusca TaxID=682080 RepID=A0A9P4QQ81_9PLEO|nr:FAD binding domain-containing protein [Polyplosphaeria fusca]
MLVTLVVPLFAALAALARAQQASSLTASIAPAATTVPVTDTDAGAELFSEESVQLTDEVVDEILGNDDIAQYADLFAFENSANVSESARRRRVRRSAKCKTSPGDLLWPSKLIWGIFDLLLGGALEPIVPIASPCYPKSEYNNYDATKCADIVTNWADGATHYENDGSMMNPLYLGLTCIEGTNTSALTTCTQGGFSSYSVHVKNVAQIQLAVNFARSLNLRLVVKNTGHDYNARSTGKHALSIWTHNMKGIQYIKNYKSATYSGPVFKLGAGVQGFELYEAADKYGVSAVAGICPTVGVAGGYVAGGGHSPLMQLFGVGSDQVVALEVVTASGRFVTATPEVNSDLYWAMLGGGGGTFGILTSAVVKVHPKVPVTVSTFNFSSAAVGADTFWTAIRFFWDEIPKYNDAKTYSYFSLMNVGGGVYTFDMFPFFATRKTVVEYEALTKPLFDKLKSLNITYDIKTTHYDTFYPAYQASFATIDFHIGSIASTPGNRIMPRENWADSALSTQTFDAVRNAVDKALLIQMYHQAPAPQAAVLNSVNPAFRNEAGMLVAINLILDTSPAGLKAGNEQLTNGILGPIREVTPKGGAYGNEGDISEPGWQQAYWGANYERLLSVKRKWDPVELFYVHHGVGSEGWVVEDGERGVQTQDGRLCRV